MNKSIAAIYGGASALAPFSVFYGSGVACKIADTRPRGHTLFPYSWLMQQAGLSRVQQQVEAFTSLGVGLAAFLNLTTFFKAPLLESDEAADLLARIRGEIEAPDEPVGLAGIFVAIGTV